MRELNIDLIDAINTYGEAYAIMAKSLGEARLRTIADVIAARRITLTPDEARMLAVRAHRFKTERGRLPSLTSPDACSPHLGVVPPMAPPKAGHQGRGRPSRDDIPGPSASSLITPAK